MVAAAGDVTIVRGAERSAAKIGAEVRSGDVVQLGEQSNAQIYFTDSSWSHYGGTEFLIRDTLSRRSSRKPVMRS